MFDLSAFQIYTIVSGLLFAVYGVIIGLLVHIYKTDQQAQDREIGRIGSEEAERENRMKDTLLNQVKANDLKFEEIASAVSNNTSLIHGIDKQVAKNTKDIEWLKKEA